MCVCVCVCVLDMDEDQRREIRDGERGHLHLCCTYGIGNKGTLVLIQTQPRVYERPSQLFSISAFGSSYRVWSDVRAPRPHRPHPRSRNNPRKSPSPSPATNLVRPAPLSLSRHTALRHGSGTALGAHAERICRIQCESHGVTSYCVTVSITVSVTASVTVSVTVFTGRAGRTRLRCVRSAFW